MEDLVTSIPCKQESGCGAQAGHWGPGTIGCMLEGRPLRKGVKLSHFPPLAQPTRAAAGTQRCSHQIPRPQRRPQVLWAQQPTGLQKAPSPGETDTLAAPSTCSPSPPCSFLRTLPSVTNDPVPGPVLGTEDQVMTDLPCWPPGGSGPKVNFCQPPVQALLPAPLTQIPKADIFFPNRCRTHSHSGVLSTAETCEQTGPSQPGRAASASAQIHKALAFRWDAPP